MVTGFAVLITLVVAGSGMAFAGTNRHRHHHPRPHPSASASLTASPDPSDSPTDPAPTGPTPTGPAPTSSSGSPAPSGSTSCPPPKFPDASCTGVPAGTALTVVNGDIHVTTPNAVIENKDVHGCILVTAPNVVIRRSKVTCGGYEAIASPDGSHPGGPLVVEDTTVRCTDQNGQTGVGDTDFIVRRLDISHCDNGFDVDANVTVEDTYVNHLHESEVAHTDAAQFSGHYLIQNGSVVLGPDGKPIVVPGSLNVTFKHNVMDGNNADDDAMQWGSSAFQSSPEGDTNVLIQDNLIMGGAISMRCDRDSPGTNYRVINNRLSTRYGPKVGFYQAGSDCHSVPSTGQVVSGNTILESGAPAPID
jgi:hypothetical protein